MVFAQTVNTVVFSRNFSPSTNLKNSAEKHKVIIGTTMTTREIKIKRDASSRWSFGPNYAWGIETTTIGKTHLTL